MTNVFNYIDYRSFLKDYYEENKSGRRNFSYRYFAMKADIKNPVFLKLVMDGKRNLTRPMIEKFCRAIGFNKKQAAYFRNLVLFNQARTNTEKQEHYAVLKSMVRHVDEKVLGTDLYDYYDKWYVSVIRELVCLYDFKDYWAGIAGAVFPAVKPSEAKDAVTFLLKKGLIRKKDSGPYIRTDRAITTGEDVQSLAVRNFNRQMIDHAKASLDAVPRSQRHVSGITMGISAETYKVLEAEIVAFKERIVQIVNTQDAADTVYQFNVLLFPVSRMKG